MNRARCMRSTISIVASTANTSMSFIVATQGDKSTMVKDFIPPCIAIEWCENPQILL